MSISSLTGLLGLVLAACGIATFFYKVWSALSARLRVNRARIDDLHDGVQAHDEVLDEIIYYLSLPEEEKKKTPFNNRAALKNLRRKAAENYESRNTSGFS
jgi:hypothetical protein